MMNGVLFIIHARLMSGCFLCGWVCGVEYTVQPGVVVMWCGVVVMYGAELGVVACGVVVGVVVVVYGGVLCGVLKACVVVWQEVIKGVLVQLQEDLKQQEASVDTVCMVYSENSLTV